jgi:SNF2 family DNA or RNA helicase
MDESDLHDYQRFAVDHVIRNPCAGLFMDMGLGKTVSTLTAVNRLMYEHFEVDRVLIIAPKRVAEDTWTTEALKWDHLRHLRLSLVLGTERERKQALSSKADIYVINRENVAWLVGMYRSTFPFDMVVIDELSSFKSPKSIRFKSLRMVRPKVQRVVGLTGTPAPNSLIDLWSQVFLLDMGERLGKTITGYRREYFNEGRRNAQVVFDYRIREGMDKAISEKISDICVSMKAEDYLPPLTEIRRVVKVHLSQKEKKQYDAFEKQLVMDLAGTEITVANAAGLSTKLRQFANGAVYDDDRNVHRIHSAKTEALGEILEETGAGGVLVLYAFQHDRTQIEREFRRYKPESIEGSETIKKWNSGQIKLLLGHPASMGHGLNLQQGGDAIVWYGPTWSSELWLQANARLLRQGRTRPVVVIQLIAEGTIDEDMVKAVEGKVDKQEALMSAVKARIRKYLG